MEEEQYLERDPIDQESHEIAFLDKHFEQNKSQENKKRKASKPKNNKECKQQKLPRLNHYFIIFVGSQRLRLRRNIIISVQQKMTTTKKVMELSLS